MRPFLLFLILLSVASVLQAQPPLDGFYVAATVSRELLGAEAGYWGPSLGVDLGDSGGEDLVLAFRIGAAGGEEEDSGGFDARVHAEGGLGGERTFLLLGPLYAFGNSDLAGAWGLRVSSGFHLNDHLTFGVHWESVEGRSTNLGGQLIFTF